MLACSCSRSVWRSHLVSLVGFGLVTVWTLWPTGSLVRVCSTHPQTACDEFHPKRTQEHGHIPNSITVLLRSEDLNPHMNIAQRKMSVGRLILNILIWPTKWGIVFISHINRSISMTTGQQCTIYVSSIFFVLTINTLHSCFVGRFLCGSRSNCNRCWMIKLAVADCSNIHVALRTCTIMSKHHRRLLDYMLLFASRKVQSLQDLTAGKTALGDWDVFKG